eukprot:617759-Pyramimonas_sp.AAC.1
MSARSSTGSVVHIAIKENRRLPKRVPLPNVTRVPVLGVNPKTNRGKGSSLIIEKQLELQILNHEAWSSGRAL